MENTVANDNYDFFEEKRYAKVEKCNCTFNLGLANMAGISIDTELEAIICELESSCVNARAILTH